jgi:hypothetical protein
VPVRRPADRRRAVLRAQPVRRRRAHPGAVGQLPQRQRHARVAAPAAAAGPARQADARGRGDAGLRREHKAFYDKLQADVAKAAGKAVTDPDAALAQVGAAAHASALVGSFNPAVILISGCQDNQTSMDGEHNGAFTEKLLKVWNQGAFQGNYGSFHARIRAALPPSQSPNLFTLGKAGVFLAQVPFTV